MTALSLTHPTSKFNKHGYRLDRTDRRALTPILAESILGVDGAPPDDESADTSEGGVNSVSFDRSLKPAHRDHLVECMEDDRMFWEDVRIKVCRMKGKVYRVNGQHTCSARIQAKLASDPVISYDIYEANDERAMRNLYRYLDGGRTRGAGDKTVAALKGIPGFTEFTDRDLNSLAFGLRYHLGENKTQRRAISTDELLSTMLQKPAQRALVLHVGSLLRWNGKAKNSAHIRRAPVMGAIMATFLKAGETDANQFWHSVIDGEMLAATDPRSLLRSRLIEIAAQEGVRRGPTTDNSADFIWHICISAWNSWRSGSKRKSLSGPIADPRLEPQ